MIHRKKLNLQTEQERDIITLMITNDGFLRKISTQFETSFVKSKAAQHVGAWCVDYHQKYLKSPGRYISNLFEDYKEKMDEDTAESIEMFLVSISDKYEKSEGSTLNIDYHVEKAIKYFNSVNVSDFVDNINNLKHSGRYEDVPTAIRDFTELSKLNPNQCFLQNPDNKAPNYEKFKDAFTHQHEERVLQLPGALGQMMGSMDRSELIAFIGPPAIGKTWWLLFAQYWAYTQGLNVVFVSLEVSLEAMIRRRAMMGLRMPKHDQDVILPYFDCHKKRDCRKSDKILSNPCFVCQNEDGFKRTVEHVTKHKRGIRLDDCSKMFPKTMRRGIEYVISAPSGTLTMESLRGQLKDLEFRYNFIPDMIITDYADKFKLRSDSQYRHQLKDIWEKHKALAQEYKCVVLTASQTSAARSGSEIKQGDWAESIAKLEIIDGGVAINQTPEEKQQGIVRLKELKDRESDFDFTKEVVVLQSIATGRPYLDSCYKSNVVY